MQDAHQRAPSKVRCVVRVMKTISSRVDRQALTDKAMCYGVSSKVRCVLHVMIIVFTRDAALVLTDDAVCYAMGASRKVRCVLRVIIDKSFRGIFQEHIQMTQYATPRAERDREYSAERPHSVRIMVDVMLKVSSGWAWSTYRWGEVRRHGLRGAERISSLNLRCVDIYKSCIRWMHSFFGSHRTLRYHRRETTQM
jgi:hypothetical protein